MFFDEKYGEKFDPANLKDKNFPHLVCIGTSLQTGLSIKLASEAKEIVEINPECIIGGKDVDRFE